MTTSAHSPKVSSVLHPSAWWYFLGFFRPGRKWIVLNLVAAAGQSLTFIPIMLLISGIFDTALRTRDYSLLIRYTGGVTLLILLNGLLTLWTQRGTLQAVKQAIQNLRSDLVLICYGISRNYYGHTDLTQIRFSIIQDTEHLDNMSVTLLTNMLPAMLVSVTLALLLFSLNGVLFLVMVGVAAICLSVSWRMKQTIGSANARYRNAQKDYNHGIARLLQIMDLTRAQSAESQDMDHQQTLVASLNTSGWKLGWLRSVYTEYQNTILSVASVLIIFIGGLTIMRGRMSVGELMAFYFLTGLMGNYLRRCWSSLPLLLSGHEALMALDGIVRQAERVPYMGTRRLTFSGQLQFDRVTFSYDREPVLFELNLILTPGSTVAVTGPSGAGKSTLLHLLMGFYRPSSGHLCADGVSYDELDVSALRREIGLVPQHPLFFPGTIRDNLLYGRPDADYLTASRMALADNFIAELPHGYDTFIGENGLLLSGGQRQRLAIARAILHRPKVLLFDEPTNHLDSYLAQRLMDQCTRLDFSPTILLISHNASLIQRMDHVYHLEQGCLRRRSELQGIPVTATR